MQTLKFKILDEFKSEILNYQREYSDVLHVCTKHLLNDLKNNQFGTMFEYKVLASSLMQKLKKLNNIEHLQNWFVQCALSEAYQIVQSFKLKQEEYKKKLQRKNELEQKEKLIKAEKKELRYLQKLKEPKVIFGGRILFKQRCKNQVSREEFKQRRLSAVYSIRNSKAI